MLNLKPFEVCPYGDSCKFRKDACMGICFGIKPNRVTSFVCDWVEEANARNNRELPPHTSEQEEERC